MLRKSLVLACPQRQGSHWRHKLRYPAGPLPPLATVRNPSFKTAVFFPLPFECSHLSLDLFRRDTAPGAD